jgi:acetolactate decarboxylase
VDAAIMVDSIKGEHLYAIGPVENLRGEIIVWDGKPFVAAITDDKKPYLQKKVKSLKAIFLVYADVSRWDTVLLTNNISSLTDLEKTITKAAFQQGTDTTTAFPFLILGKVKEGSGHIMYKDSLVTDITPAALKDANYKNSFSNQYAQMLGFYSQHHQTIFTHHDSFLHIHYRMANKYQAGHLDMVSFDVTEPLKLLLPRK